MEKLAFPDKYPELFQLIVQSLYGTLTADLKLDHQAAASTAFKAANDAMHKVGGGLAYIPKGLAYQADQRADAIYERYNGRNLTELARDFELTEARVRQILNERHPRELARRQGTLGID